MKRATSVPLKSNNKAHVTFGLRSRTTNKDNHLTKLKLSLNRNDLNIFCYESKDHTSTLFQNMTLRPSC